MRPNKEEIKSIYSGIETCGHSYDPQGWNSNTPIFEEVIRKLRPTTIVEVGAWKGASTAHMAGLCKGLGLETVIYSVDCWVGPLGVRLAKTPKSHIPTHWTAPTFYQQFLYNIHKTGHSDCVVPFQAMSVPAAKVLGDWGVRPELIYEDAAHDFQSTWDELNVYWPLLAPGGIMLGDDYRSQKHVYGEMDVGAAVRKFAEVNNLKYHVTNDTRDAQWWIEKK